MIRHLWAQDQDQEQKFSRILGPNPQALGVILDQVPNPQVQVQFQQPLEEINFQIQPPNPQDLKNLVSGPPKDVMLLTKSKNKFCLASKK